MTAPDSATDPFLAPPLDVEQLSLLRRYGEERWLHQPSASAAGEGSIAIRFAGENLSDQPSRWTPERAGLAASDPETERWRGPDDYGSQYRAKTGIMAPKTSVPWRRSGARCAPLGSGKGGEMDTPYEAGSDVTVLPNHLDVPGVGTLLVNAFVLQSEQPVLIDTGIGLDSDSFIEALRSVVDPRDLRWIWLTHDDSDHTGALPALMQAAPNARLATHALGALRMSTWFPLGRIHAISPGATIDAGDRTLRAVMPPTFDNPTSTALYDESTSTLFCVDAFGAIIPRALTSLDDLTEDELVGGMTAWTTFDSPWAHMTDRSRFGQALDVVRTIAPHRVLSAHLPPAMGRLEELLKIVSSVPDADPFQAPDAEGFAQIAAAIAAGPAPA